MKPCFLFVIATFLLINSTKSQVDTNAIKFLSGHAEWSCRIFHGDFCKNEQSLLFNDSIVLNMKLLGKKAREHRGNLFRKIEMSCHCNTCVDSNCFKPFSAWNGTLSIIGDEVHMYFDVKYFIFLSQTRIVLYSELLKALECMHLFITKEDYILQGMNETGLFLTLKTTAD